MPRPKKTRKVQGVPPQREYGPYKEKDGKKPQAILLSVDEYETIRLIDYEALTQKACSEKMDVSRTTIQSIYSTARKKISASLIEGKPLVIDGGDYSYQSPQALHLDERYTIRNMVESAAGTKEVEDKPRDVKRIAVSLVEGEVAHIGESEQFKIMDVKDRKIISEIFVDRPDIPGGFLPMYLKSQEVDLLIGADMGKKLRHHFDSVTIDIFITDKAYAKDALSHWLRS